MEFSNSTCATRPKTVQDAKLPVRSARRHVAVGAVKGEDAKMIGERRGP